MFGFILFFVLRIFIYSILILSFISATHLLLILEGCISFWQITLSFLCFHRSQAVCDTINLYLSVACFLYFPSVFLNLSYLIPSRVLCLVLSSSAYCSLPWEICIAFQPFPISFLSLLLCMRRVCGPLYLGSGNTHSMPFLHSWGHFSSRPLLICGLASKTNPQYSSLFWSTLDLSTVSAL